jgi:hypothetical protein
MTARDAAMAKYVSLLVVALAAGAALVVLGPRLLGLAAGPEAELVTLLKSTERKDLALEVPGTQQPLRSRRHEYQRLTVWLDPDGEVAHIAATLQFEGRLGDVDVSSLGVEQIPFRRAGSDWIPVKGLAPNLVAVVGALERRRQALSPPSLPRLERLLPPDAGLFIHAGGDLALLGALAGAGYTAKSWYIRIDRDAAQVAEDYRLVGTLPDRPVDQVGTRRLDLIRHNNSEFYFWPGLM